MKLKRLLTFSLLLCFVFPVFAHADQLEDAKAAIDNEKYKKASKILLPLADEGNAEAQFLMGAMYCNGQGVKEDCTKGLSLMMKSATQGFEPAKIRALELCVNLAKDGDPAAMYNVGYMCLKGWGGEQDSSQCIEWLETAAKLGHTRSAKVLSSIYKKGKYGIESDKEKASYWKDMAEATIDGTWQGTVPGGMGGQPMTITYKFKAKGDTLTGQVSGGPGQWLEIQDGKITGNEISFVVETEFNEMKMTFKYTGKLMGNDLQLAYSMGMGGGGGGFGGGGPGMQPPPTKFVAKRVR